MTLEGIFLGPAAELLRWLRDEKVTDILINGPGQLFVESNGALRTENSPFSAASEILDLIERLLIPLGKRIDAAAPYADGSLCDGSRFHIILPPLAAHGPCISIRRFKNQNELTLESFGPPKVIAWLRENINQRKNLLIAGGTGSGKTTLLSLLLNEVPSSQRIIVVEECREIVSLHPHLVFLEARSANPEGRGGVPLRALLRNALRMRPDRLILGECRGEEAFDMLQTMSTGHAGSMGTVHANHALDALRRMEVLATLSGLGLTSRILREWVSGAIQAVVHLERRGPERRIREIIDVNGLEGEVYRAHPRYLLED